MHYNNFWRTYNNLSYGMVNVGLYLIAFGLLGYIFIGASKGETTELGIVGYVLASPGYIGVLVLLASILFLLMENLALLDATNQVVDPSKKVNNKLKIITSALFLCAHIVVLILEYAVWNVRLENNAVGALNLIINLLSIIFYSQSLHFFLTTKYSSPAQISAAYVFYTFVIKTVITIIIGCLSFITYVYNCKVNTCYENTAPQMLVTYVYIHFMMILAFMWTGYYVILYTVYFLLSLLCYILAGLTGFISFNEITSRFYCSYSELDVYVCCLLYPRCPSVSDPARYQQNTATTENILFYINNTPYWVSWVLWKYYEWLHTIDYYTITVEVGIVVRERNQEQKIQVTIQENGAEQKRPLTIYKYRDMARIMEDKRAECIICLVTFVDIDDIYMTPCCHIYHAKCLDKWLEQKKQCPLCKRDV